jgi:hypothetical protein
MPKYRTTVQTFIAPELLKPGVVFLYDGPPSLTWEPLDDEAREKVEELYKAKPHALVNPLDSLRVNGGAPGDVVEPTLQILDQPSAKEEEVLNLGTLAQPGKARPGPTEGGKALPIG